MDIPDAYLFPIEGEEERKILLSEGQHILRRFGQIEKRAHAQGDVIPFMRRVVADEIWIPVLGSIMFQLHDLRPDSPSYQRDLSVELDAEDPQGLLIPFGVAYAYRVQSAGVFLRISTHADGTHPQDDSPLPEDFNKILENAES